MINKTIKIIETPLENKCYNCPNKYNLEKQEFLCYEIISKFKLSTFMNILQKLMILPKISKIKIRKNLQFGWHKSVLVSF